MNPPKHRGWKSRKLWVSVGTTFAFAVLVTLKGTLDAGTIGACMTPVLLFLGAEGYRDGKHS